MYTRTSLLYCVVCKSFKNSTPVCDHCKMQVKWLPLSLTMRSFWKDRLSRASVLLAMHNPNIFIRPLPSPPDLEEVSTKCLLKPFVIFYIVYSPPLMLLQITISICWTFCTTWLSLWPTFWAWEALISQTSPGTAFQPLPPLLTSFAISFWGSFTSLLPYGHPELD